ncbi:UPF0480 protein C15orf24-like [Tropilaelaps mercedesae]|uniref:UPF0480 protein C15orf24-like n=1 Tax=Tropilaelaps mercedesae TaxID=418985 RepID=A0A1V9XCK9_9ACAR|nr:UPF0480 protein C15orf24-like [Tropilaelaps mercedesae]
MVLTMVLPVFLIMVLPKLMSAEAMARTQRDVQQIQSAARMSEMPDLSEMMTSLLGNQQGKGGQPARIQGGGQGSSGGGGGGGGGASGSGKKKN